MHTNDHSHNTVHTQIIAHIAHTVCTHIFKRNVPFFFCPRMRNFWRLSPSVVALSQGCFVSLFVFQTLPSLFPCPLMSHLMQKPNHAHRKRTSAFSDNFTTFFGSITFALQPKRNWARANPAGHKEKVLGSRKQRHKTAQEPTVGKCVGQYSRTSRVSQGRMITCH